MPLGILKTEKSVERAMIEVRSWLGKIGIAAFSIDLSYGARLDVATAMLKFHGKDYEFRSTRQGNCRLNMWAIARVMEYKVRSHLMGIEDFDKSMVAYLRLENKSGVNNEASKTNEKYYAILGLTSLASNQEIKNRHMSLCKTYHPDMALSEEAKQEFTRKMSEINEAFSEIKKERDF